MGPGALSASECVCDTGFFYNDGSTQKECQSCGLSFGESPRNACPANTSLSNVALDPGHWRISEGSAVTYECISGENKSIPCRGGSSADTDGVGYCAEGYHGPKCQLCSSPDHYFAFSSGECRECPKAGRTTGILFSIFAVFGAMLGLLYLIFHVPNYLPKPLAVLAWFMRRIVNAFKLFDIAPKFKMVFSFCQVAAALPSVYGLSHDLVERVWGRTFELFHLDFETVLLDGMCVGTYVHRLSLYCLVPLALMGAILLGGALYHVIAVYSGRSSQSRVSKTGLLTGMPAMLVTMFALLPMISAKIFHAFVCTRFVVTSSQSASEGSATYRYFLDADNYRVECDDGPEYAQVRATAVVFMLLWPIGMPIVFLLLLFRSRKAIQSRRPNALSNAIKFLHKEYEPAFFWWEPLEMMRKLFLTGFLLVLVEDPEKDFKRIFVATLVSLIFMLLTALARPFRSEANDFFCVGVHLVLVCMFLTASMLKLFVDFETYSPGSPSSVMGYDDDKDIAFVMLAFTGCIIVMSALFAIYTAWTMQQAPTIRLVETRARPQMTLSRGQTWHVFLSHIWGSGQDQCAIIKRQLQRLLSDVYVFLDVDDLQDISKLEEYISATASIMIFLSKGYFFSANCMREAVATTKMGKPILLMHEADVNKGGLSVEQAIDDCPEHSITEVDGVKIFHPLRSKIFFLNNRHSKSSSLDSGGSASSEPDVGRGHPRNIITWHRVYDFQLQSIKLLSHGILQGMPTFKGKEPAIFTPGEVTSKTFRFRHSLHIYTSPNNPGAVELMEELRSAHPEAFQDKVTWTSVQPTTITIFRGESKAAFTSMSRSSITNALSMFRGESEAAGTSMSRSSITKALSLTSQESHSPPIAPVSDRGVSSRADVRIQVDAATDAKQGPASNESSELPCTHMLLLVNKLTWVGEAGQKLQNEVRAMMAANLPIMLMHEVDPERNGCEFGLMFASDRTPKDLIDNKLYAAIAAPFHSGGHRQVSYALALRNTMGAAEVKKNKK